MGTEFLGRDVKESVAEADSIGDGTVSAWNTNKGKGMSPTRGPDRSAAGNGACVSAACGWAERCVGRRQQRWAARFAREKRKKNSSLGRKRPAREEKEWAAAAGLRAEKKEKVFLFFFSDFSS